MKILMLSWEYPPKNVGGLAEHVSHLSRALARHGLEVHVLTVGGNEAVPYEECDGVKIHRVSTYNLSAPDFRTWILHLNFSLLEYAVTLINTIKNIDIVHAHDWLVAFTGRALKHVFQLPLVATIHATEYGRNHGLHNEHQRYISDVEWWLTYEAWQVIVCSSYMKRELGGFFQLPDDKMTVIPNGVEIEEAQLKVNKIQGQEKYIFFIGRLVREKGVQVLMDAAPKILNNFPEARFIIAGTGPFEEHLRARARELRLEHRVHFAGYVNEQMRAKLYKQSSVAVFPSLYEPFGIVALEAMAAGTPVVVADTGGFGEIVEHGVDGLKCYVGSADSLADNIMAVLGNRNTAEQLRKNGFATAKNRYSWANVALQTAGVYENVVRQANKKEWHTDTWMASDSISAVYGKLKNIGKMNIFSQRAH